MLFGSLNLKRKFLAIVDPTSAITNYNVNGYNRARKRMQIEKPTSIHELNLYNSQGARAAGHHRAETQPRDEEKQQDEEEGEDLEAKLKKSEETCARVKKEVEYARVRVKKLREHNLNCMICHEMIQNPQILECGHSACYPCLRRSWTKPPIENDGALMIDTEAESDQEEEEIYGTDGSNLIDPALAPRPRRRHRFSSAVDRKKHCPYCKTVIKSRPAPNFRIRAILEAMNSQLLPLPPHVQARMDSRRADLWHGMFYPAQWEPLPEYERVGEEGFAARERARDLAIAEGLAAGAVEARREWARLNQTRGAAMVVPTLEQLNFWRGNPPHAA